MECWRNNLGKGVRPIEDNLASLHGIFRSSRVMLDFCQSVERGCIRKGPSKKQMACWSRGVGKVKGTSQDVDGPKD